MANDTQAAVPEARRGVTSVGVYAVAYTDERGRECTCLCVSFGKDKEGKPGVFVLVDDAEMRSGMKIAATHIRDKVIDYRNTTATGPGVIPDSILPDDDDEDEDVVPVVKKPAPKKKAAKA